MTLDIGVSPSAQKVKWTRRSLSGNRLNIVMVGRFSDYQKRQDLLVEALAIILKGYRVHLTFIGDGMKKEAIQSRVNDLGMDECITFLPFFNKQQELWQVLLNSDLLVHACDYEGLCKSIIESMALGLPVLVSDVTPLNR
ncbi:hypothetical protein EL17_11220 [Anditalea andensis]|uniref:Glycosyl transferase family 1 domain-containing protein n=1 Tax=Anditalea andensis TaxID=1048983 RepID=A0A074KU15_9BACT|nr:glycosyltransferase [Anditalea andensis]KEO73471.1 hypothetical protein EL17_11220 [Anditalea andensis]